jgi:hypothetical protein
MGLVRAAWQCSQRQQLVQTTENQGKAHLIATGLEAILVTRHYCIQCCALPLMIFVQI